MAPMSHGEHEHRGDHDRHAHEAEPFPRIETATLVAEEIAREQRRQRVQLAFVALGVMSIALGLPAHFEIGHSEPLVEATARGEWSALDLGSSVLARVLHAALPVTAAQAWFLLSALALGATAALCMSMGRKRGFSATATILATLVVVAAPCAWIAGTTPGAAACGLFGATWLFAVLDSSAAGGQLDSANDARTFARRASIAWFFATLLHPWNAWLWPAYAWSLARRRRSMAAIAVAALLAWAALVLGATAFEHGTEALPKFLGSAWRALLAGGSGGPGPVFVWSIAWTYALAGAGLGLLLVAKRAIGPRATRPPVWMMLFALVPLLALGLGGVATFDDPYLWLAPIALVGTLEILQRRPALAVLALGLDVAVVVIATFVRESQR